MAKILVIDDERSILETLAMFLTEKGHTVFKAPTGNGGLKAFHKHQPDMVILDIHLPDKNGLEVLQELQKADPPSRVLMITAFHDLETTVQAMKHGAYDYIHKPLDIDEIEKAVERMVQVMEIEQETPVVESAGQQDKHDVLVGESKEMLDIMKKIGILCQNRTPVLIQGETGTGKELVARMLHRNSPHHEASFVVMDCSSVVDTLIESEIFGYEKGAFTGANRTHKGKIEAAGEGTLFLDEIGELSLNLQGKLLGFLQRREFMRVGGTQMLQSHCRIIAATNRDLAEMVRQKKFKDDLYYRLKVVTLHLPALRERSSDIQLLVRHFLPNINKELGTDVSKLQDGVMEQLAAYPWPGNVRELKHTLLEAILQTRGKAMLLEDLEQILHARMAANPAPSQALSSHTLDNMEKEHIEHVLAEVSWRRTEAARRLEISLPTLRSKIRKYGIIPPEDSESNLSAG